MQTRREFLAALAATAAVAPAGAASLTAPQPIAPAPTESNPRAYWTGLLCRVAEPVLSHLAENQLRARMPVEAAPGKRGERAQVTHLEAFARTLCGLAPWLELAPQPAGEAQHLHRLAAMVRRGLEHATNPAAPDAMNFTAGGQPLVDAGFLSQALLRAPNALWKPLDPAVQKRVIASLQSTRSIKPGNSNWLLFSAMVETFLAWAGAEWQSAPIDIALKRHEEWYKGDGLYGDGPELHFDYYNSYVIQPFLVDVLEHAGKVTPQWSSLLEKVRSRAQRYAAIQERLIAPDGSFPAVGRSLAYRCGAFHLLAQTALRGQLPEALSPAQVRGALTAVIARTLEAPDTFDAEGWLRIGLCGHQPNLAEPYISTGSTYLCTAAFLPLGLPPENPFWSAPAADWTSRKLWSGKDLPADHALKEPARK